jgi:hypothetical protein
MKRQGDRQIQEEDEKGKLTDRFRKRMKRQTDRQVQEEDKKGKLTDKVQEEA